MKIKAELNRLYSIIEELKDCYLFEDTEMPNDIKSVINQLNESEDYYEVIDILNKLLINPNHHGHQAITKLLQHLGSPSSIPYIKEVIDSNFEYLKYTYSESSTIAKWFSWALASIGTKEAIDLIKEYAEKSNDKGIKDQMLYRLSRLEDSRDFIERTRIKF